MRFSFAVVAYRRKIKILTSFLRSRFVATQVIITVAFPSSAQSMFFIFYKCIGLCMCVYILKNEFSTRCSVLFSFFFFLPTEIEREHVRTPHLLQVLCIRYTTHVIFNNIIVFRLLRPRNYTVIRKYTIVLTVTSGEGRGGAVGQRYILMDRIYSSAGPLAH